MAGTTATAAEAADYIATLAAELAGMAREADFRLVEFLLEMASLEAENQKSLRSPSRYKMTA